ncbi:hypothetical protein K469DRAFT_789322 [Zopfia rhizophila CBS 207.26]|uniref:Uncharacterized protein n=1 Tax=Zopfia rhizophila CBS 207.26 TaxID=1314779 RepID=A0A6A6ES01_9PEZI|nr:hypothetical protein K469DRAFT_789322 [Zopfia rhizophila CBS 207.26]
MVRIRSVVPKSIVLTTTLVSEASLGGSQSQTSFTTHQESETSTDELAPDVSPPAKRSAPKTHHSRRQKRNTGGSSTRQSSAAGTAQSEQWSWANGAFQCFQGQTLVKSQDQTPPDVWVYFDQSWPGEGGKKWRRWLSATNQMEYR